jgi:hypothetical protein
VVTIPVVGLCGDVGIDFYSGKASPIAVAA